MINLIYRHWMRPLKMLLAGTVVSVSIWSPISSQV
jgi:hypothetical protein